MCDLARSFPNAPESAALIRADVLAFARRFPFDEDELWQIMTAVGEGVANAIEHGYAPQTLIDIRCGHDERRITIEIKDAGGGLSDERVSRPLVKSEAGGRGLGIMRSVVDEVRLDVRPGGGTLFLSKVARSGKPFLCS